MKNARHAAQLGQIERVECALLVLAYCIELDGDVHLPMYRQFEAELAELKSAAKAKLRAGERLAAFRRSLGLQGDLAQELNFQFESNDAESRAAKIATEAQTRD